jgi:hypothetical protein
MGDQPAERRRDRKEQDVAKDAKKKDLELNETDAADVKGGAARPEMKKVGSTRPEMKKPGMKKTIKKSF